MPLLMSLVEAHGAQCRTESERIIGKARQQTEAVGGAEKNNQINLSLFLAPLVIPGK
jgi:hypothetical protein